MRFEISECRGENILDNNEYFFGMSNFYFNFVGCLWMWSRYLTNLLTRLINQIMKIDEAFFAWVFFLAGERGSFVELY